MSKLAAIVKTVLVYHCTSSYYVVKFWTMPTFLLMEYGFLTDPCLAPGKKTPTWQSLKPQLFSTVPRSWKPFCTTDSELYKQMLFIPGV